jgi:serine/threonine-protein kinase
MADVLASDELVDEVSDYGSIQPGHRLGRYELLVPIARGGMARVWAARLHGQRGFQKLVAIKTILPHLADEPEFERMFLDEARIASGVHHPNVCEIYELGEEKKTLYLAMEWVSGDSFARVLRASGKTEPVEPRVVARIVADACAGLHAAHELADDDGRSLGVVHRDLSPHNILLTADGTAKVADFGVAKALGQLHEATSAGQLKGKIAYMAPEQVTGSAIDRRSDVFSLGCVLYEATTGQRPFRGDGDHQVMHAVLKGEYAAPTSLIRNYPVELERIVARALQQQPILRYPTAERMRFALEEFVARGQLVTQSNVAQVVRARIGEQIDRRKERIRQASTTGDREGGWAEAAAANRSSANEAVGGHRSGVKPSGAHANARPLYTTMQMDRPPPAIATNQPPLNVAPLTPQLSPQVAAQPVSSTTIPQAAVHPYAQSAPHAHDRGHTPVSHPGAAHSSSGRAAPAVPPVFAQTALMPPNAQMPAPPLPPPPSPAELPNAGGPPATTEQMRPFTLPPNSSLPPQSHGMQGAPPMTFPPGSNAFGQGPPLGHPQSSQLDGSAALAANDGRGSTPPASTTQYAIAIGIGILVAAVIGVGGFMVWRSRHAVATEPVAAGASSVVPVPVPLPMPLPNGDPAKSAASTKTVSTEITFRIVPSEATLSIEGKDLAADARTIPRPPVGQTVNVVARAPGHEDTTILVDYFTTSPMELTLKRAGTAAAAPSVPAVADPSGPAAVGATTATTAAAADPAPIPTEKEPPKKPKPQNVNSGLPSNPY